MQSNSIIYIIYIYIFCFLYHSVVSQRCSLCIKIQTFKFWSKYLCLSVKMLFSQAQIQFKTQCQKFTSDCCLVGQVEVLQEEALLKQQEVQTDNFLLAGLQKNIRPPLQQNSSLEHIVSTAQVNTQFDSY